jgi:glycosyltransferase involved in cell wall biosynthesis
MSAEISVVIPTKDRKELLGACLESLRRQTLAPSQLIVVDNGSSDGTAEFVRERFPGVIVAREARPGVDRARNRGVAEATAPLVAFADDDVILPPTWLESLAGCFDDPKVGGAGGPVYPLWPRESLPALLASPRVRSCLGLLELGPFARAIDPQKEFLCGSNCAFRRSLVSGDRGFRGLWEFPGLGVCGDDYELSRRLARESVVVYEPRAYALHRIAARKLTWPHLLRRVFIFEAAGTRVGHRLKRKRRWTELAGLEGLVSAAVALGHAYGRVRQKAL